MPVLSQSLSKNKNERLAFPNSKAYANLFLRLAGSGIDISEPKVVGENLELYLDSSKILVPASEQIRSICSYEWTNIGSYDVKFQKVIPEFRTVPSGILLVWTFFPLVRLTYSILRWAVAKIRDFIITPEYGQLNISGIKTPKLIWS